MLCAISGEAPRVPVASRKSGNVFEKSLVEAYIQENGKDPVNNEDLSIDDLVELKSPRIVRPRPPTLTSIPSLLSKFQDEWDALALENYTLKQNLTQTRQELSTALYQHDAAVRVIARLSRERNEARDALSRLAVNGTAANNVDAMQVDGQELSSALVEKIEATKERLSKSRRKRAVPDGWATSDDIKSFNIVATSEPLYPGALSVSVNATGDLALVGGSNGIAGVWSIPEKKVLSELDVGSGAITDAIWIDGRAAFATAEGHVKIFQGKNEVANFKGHSGAVAALALHPCKEILASVGPDKSYIYYDLSALAQGFQAYTDTSLTSAEFHPDGHLFAAGGADGQIKIYVVTSGANAANLDVSAPVQALSFSENGTWLAAVSKGSTNVSIWDLRKSTQIKLLEIGSQIERLRWDWTGQFLAIAGRNEVSIQQYSKSTKAWSEPLRTPIPVVALEWGVDAQSLISLALDGSITILGLKQK